MAFRRFTEAETPQPEGMPYTAHAVSGLVDSINRRRLAEQTAKRNAIAQYKADSYASKFNTDSEDFLVLGRDVTSQAVNEMMASPSGQTSGGLRDKQARYLGYKNQSDAQWQQLQDLQGTIAQTKFETGGKNYYNPKPDADRLIEAAYGADGERITWFNRGERLDAVGKTLGSDLTKSFDKEGYLSDYVERIKTQVRESKNKSMSGYEKSGKIDAVFLDENGNPKVTDEHAINYLQSSSYTTGVYQQELNKQLLSEAKRMMATPEGAKLKGLTEEQIIAGMRTTPDDPNYIKNTINDLAPGIRERNMAKIDLEKKQRVNLTNSTDAGSYDPGARDGVTSKTWTVNDSFSADSAPGPGGTFGNKGASSQVSPKIKVNGTVLTPTGPIGTKNSKWPDSTADSWNLALIGLNGQPVPTDAKNTDELISQINSMPLNQVQQLQLMPVIKGKLFDKASVINRAGLERDKLLFKPNKSDSENETLKSLENLLISANNSDIELAPEVYQAALGPLLGTIVTDYVKPVTSKDGEVADIKSRLGPYDITNPKYWDEDAKRVQQAWNKRKQEATAAHEKAVKEVLPPQGRNMKNNPPEGKSKKTAKFPLPKGQAETVNQNGFDYTWDYEIGGYH